MNMKIKKKKKKKILQIGKYYFPFQGGIENIVQNISEGLYHDGHTVEVLCSAQKAKNEYDEVNKIKITRTARLLTLFSQPILPFLFFHLWKALKGKDIIHLHSPNPLAEIMTLLIPSKIPIVITYHSDIVRQKTLLLFYRPFLMMALKKAKAIIVPTQNHIKYSPFLPKFEEKCHIVPFGQKMDYLVRTQKTDLLINQLKKDHGRFVLFVGRVVGYKGLTYLISAMKNSPYHCVIIGSGPLEEELKQQIKNQNLEHKVSMLGKVMDDELFKAYFYACEAFILPSISANENFGVVQIEAMYCERPVITTSIKSGVPAVGIPNKTTLLVPPKNPNALCEAMSKLYHNDILRKSLGKEGKKRADMIYTLDKMIQGHNQVYDLVSKAQHLMSDKETAA